MTTLFSETFAGSSIAPEVSVTEFSAYSQNPIINNDTVSAASLGNPKEPDAIKIGSLYYAVVTLWSDYLPPAMANRKVVLISSSNLISWNYVQTIKTAAHGATIFEWNSAYHVLYSYDPSGTEAIGWTHAVDPTGVWTDEGTILEDGTRDPYVVIDSGTVTLYTINQHVYYRTTTTTDFTSLSAQTEIITATSGIAGYECPTIITIGATYYLFLGEVKSGPNSNRLHNIKIYTGTSATGPWTEWGYGIVKGAGVTWHDESHGHLTFIRSGDIEDNSDPLEVDGAYPILIEGADGARWTTGLYYGKKTATRTTFTQITSSDAAVATIDVANQRLWLERYTGDLLSTLDYTLPAGKLWTVSAIMATGAFLGTNTKRGIGLLGYINATNWWTVRLSPDEDLIHVGRLLYNSFSWLEEFVVAMSPQADHLLSVSRTRNANTLSVSLGGETLGTATDPIFELNATLGFSTFYAAGDVDSVIVSEDEATTPLLSRTRQVFSRGNVMWGG